MPIGNLQRMRGYAVVDPPEHRDPPGIGTTQREVTLRRPRLRSGAPYGLQWRAMTSSTRATRASWSGPEGVKDVVDPAQLCVCGSVNDSSQDRNVLLSRM